MTSIEIVALALAAAAAATDLRSARIPNLLTFGAAGLGLAFHAAMPGGQGLTASLIGLATGLAVFFPFFALGAMGAGDVKLMAALGAWLGWHPAIYIALYTALAGGVLAVCVSVLTGYMPTAMSNLRALVSHWWLTGLKPLPALTLESGSGPRLPYAVPILAGVAVTLWQL